MLLCVPTHMPGEGTKTKFDRWHSGLWPLKAPCLESFGFRRELKYRSVAAAGRPRTCRGCCFESSKVCAWCCDGKHAGKFSCPFRARHFFPGQFPPETRRNSTCDSSQPVQFSARPFMLIPESGFRSKSCSFLIAWHLVPAGLRLSGVLGVVISPTGTTGRPWRATAVKECIWQCVGLHGYMGSQLAEGLFATSMWMRAQMFWEGEVFHDMRVGSGHGVQKGVVLLTTWWRRGECDCGPCDLCPGTLAAVPCR